MNLKIIFILLSSPALIKVYKNYLIKLKKEIDKLIYERLNNKMSLLLYAGSRLLL